MRALIAAGCLALACVPAWAVNKCKTPEGKTVFQDLPCATGQGEKIEVRPASGSAPSAAPTPYGAAAVPATAAGARPNAKAEGVFGEKWQRLQFLQNRGVPEARAEVQNTVTNCDAQQSSLAFRKNFANNNLAGATLEQAISTEMQARATVCDTKIRDARAQLDRLEREMAELQSVVK